MSIYSQLLSICSRLPLSFMQTVARCSASIINTFKLSKLTRVIHINLEIALHNKLSEEQKKRITQQAIKNELLSYFEFFNIWGATQEENLQKIHQVNGEEYFHQALAENKGVVLIVPHFGTWEIMNAWCAQHTKMTILYKPVKNEVVDKFVRDARSREQAHLVPTNETGVREIFKALKQGETTVILPDHTPQIENDMVEYFGIPLYSSNLSAKLIQKTKAKALFLYAMRNEQGGFTMNIEPIDDRIYQGSANDGTRVIFEYIENLIIKYPEHYHWSYKRFKANPTLDAIYHHQDLDEIKEMVERVRVH